MPQKTSHFAGRIRELRVRGGLNLTELASRIGVSVGCVSEWESEVARPPLYRLDLIAAALGVSIGELFDRPGRNVPAPRRGRPRKESRS